MLNQDLLGGDLVLGEVLVDRTRVGHHYWNRLPDGSDVDFTADRFYPGEVVTGGQVQQRPPNAPMRCREQYELRRRRVLAALASSAGSASMGSEGPGRGPRVVCAEE